jgi:RNA polymerase sigma factor (sigma-70 family)
MLVTMSANDLDLLRDFARDRSQDAFTTIVQRHLDLVYCAALRQVRSRELAEEVAQSVFSDLARDAARLKPDTVLTAWLYEVTRRTAINVVRGETRRRFREQIACEMNAMNATAADWTQIEPLLDEAMHALDDTDRTAVLLRYFENKSLREVGQTLGTSDDTAQKRVSRAVERLREFFSKRGVTVGAGVLTVIISANAVHAAPVGLTVTISTAALAGATLVTTATTTATKAIAMTTMQKTIIAATLAAAVGTGVYEAHQASVLRSQVLALLQQQAPLSEQIQQLARERGDSARQLASLSEENERLNHNTAELLKLRGEVGALRRRTDELGKRREEITELRQTPPEETQTLSQVMDWVRVKQLCMRIWLQAFFAYARANQGQCPETFQQAASFLPESLKEISLTAEQFEILHQGSLDAIKDQDMIVFREKNVWQHFGGKWGRLYGIADGNVQYCSSSDKTATGSFDEYEKQHIVQSRGQ